MKKRSLSGALKLFAAVPVVFALSAFIPNNTVVKAVTNSVDVMAGATIGNIDNATPYNGAISEQVTLSDGETVSFTFKNYSSKAANWNNWLTFVSEDKDAGNNYIGLRADLFELVSWSN